MTGIVYEFDGLRLDTARRTLTGQRGPPLDVPSRAMDALLLLVERRGLVLDRTALIAALWPDTVVSENSLDQVMTQLRRILGNGNSRKSSIRTERGRGYRFEAPMQRIRLDRAPGARSPRSEPRHSTHRARAQRLCVQARALSTRPSVDNLRAAFELAERASSLDPSFAQARALLALIRTVFIAFDLPMTDALPLAEQDARQALNAEPTLAIGHQALGNVLAARGAWREAEAHYEAACRHEQEPDARVTRIWQLVQSVGHLRRSLRLATQIDTLAPSQPLGAVAAAQACCLLGLDTDAARHADTAASLGWPLHHPVACDLRAQLALRSRQYADAAEWMTRSIGSSMRAAGGAQIIGTVCTALDTPNQRPTAVRNLKLFAARLAAGDPGALDRRRIVLWQVMLGGLPEAFDFLNRSLDRFALAGMVGISWGWLWMPEMQPLRADPRFGVIVERLRFADYWNARGAPDGHRLSGGTLTVSRALNRG